MVVQPLWRRGLRSRLFTLIDGLGASAFEVAAHLKRLGVQGVPRAGPANPVAVFLNAIVATEPGVASVATTATSITVRPASSRRRSIVVPLSEPIQRFLSDFDEGGFPDLVATWRVPDDGHPFRSDET